MLDRSSDRPHRRDPGHRRRHRARGVLARPGGQSSTATRFAPRPPSSPSSPTATSTRRWKSNACCVKGDRKPPVAPRRIDRPDGTHGRDPPAHRRAVPLREHNRRHRVQSESRTSHWLHLYLWPGGFWSLSEAVREASSCRGCGSCGKPVGRFPRSGGKRLAVFPRDRQLPSGSGRRTHWLPQWAQTGRRHGVPCQHRRR